MWTQNILYNYSSAILSLGCFTMDCASWFINNFVFLFSDFIKVLQGNFKLVKECKPRASRKESAEIYLYAENFRK